MIFIKYNEIEVLFGSDIDVGSKIRGGIILEKNGKTIKPDRPVTEKVNAIAKYLLTTDGLTIPFAMYPEQWEMLREEMKKGNTKITTTDRVMDVFAVLEIAKGYVGQGVSNSEDGMLMIFSKE